MPFTPKSWGNFNTGGTPLTGASLIDLETRLSNYSDQSTGVFFNVLAYGAVGNGVANDTTPIANACTAAALTGGIVWFPPGTYLSDINVPDGISLWGAGSNSSIILGVLTSIGSRTAYRGLKIGKTGSRQTFGTNATDVVFEDCWLFGGDAGANISINDNSVTNVRFIDCDLSGNTSAGNGVQIVDKGTVLKHMEDITFTRCHFYGNDRMNFECIQRNDVGFPVVQGYRNISLYDCILDIAAGATGNQINISYDGGPIFDSSVRSSGYSTVRNCKITGGVYGIELAGPTDMLIEGNDISATTSDLLSMSQYGTAASEKHIARIIGNTFNGPVGNVVLKGQGIVFAGNDVQIAGALRLDACSFSTITGNMIGTTGTTALSLEHSGNNTIIGNQVRGGSNQSFLFIYVETVDNLVDGNYIDALGVEFDVRDGTLQHYGGRNIEIFSGVAYELGRDRGLKQPAYSASITLDASDAQVQQIIATNGTAFTINAPTHPVFGYELTVEIQNSSGGALGVITWNAVFKLAGAFTNPANGKRRSVTFYYDRPTTLWVEKSRTAADI